MTLHPSWVEIDLKQFAKNIAVIRHFTHSRLICLPLKANAYGHGICPIGKCAEKAGVDYLAVAHLQEGILLREAGIQIPILVLGAIDEHQIDSLIEYDLEFSLSSKFKADLVCAKAPKKKCRVHLDVDTGMQRTGMRPATAKELFKELQHNPFIEVVGMYSHFATADEPNHPFARKQIEIFQNFLSDPIFKNPPLIRHQCNSGGFAYYPEAHLDMIRPGIIAYGHFPAPFENIAPFFSLKARIVYNKVVDAGVGISYGHSYVTPKKTRIVTIPVGYGDGFLRCLSNKGSVLIRGKRFPIVGNICMDQFMVDVGDHEAYIGDEVVLIGKQGKEEISVKEISDLCGTIPYETLCLLNNRLPRIYLE